MIGIPHGKKSAEITVFSSIPSFQVTHKIMMVLLFEFHIPCQDLLAITLAEQFVNIFLAVVYLYVFYSKYLVRIN